MSSKPISPFRRAWYRWKALRLPWRKRFLVGLDLSGNTFWEFKDALSTTPGRMRRIVQYPASTHYSEVSGKISPAWHQWLRRTRSDPPSLAEQSQDLVRQENLKILAAQADARWAAKASVLDSPSRGRPALPSVGGRESGVQSLGRLDNGLGVKNTAPAATMTRPEVPGAPVPPALDAMQRPDVRRNDTKEVKKETEEAEDTTRRTTQTYENDPWKQARGGASEEWQPQSWDPNVGIAKR